MIYVHVVLSLLTIAVFAILRKIHLRLLCTEKNKDLISQLPDDILISIISRLSTEDATRTSLLSRRWRNLYKFAPKIQMCCYFLLNDVPPLNIGMMTSIWLQRCWRHLYRYHRFGSHPEHKPHSSEFVMNALDRFLRPRSGSKISSFRLKCCLNNSVTGQFERCVSSLGRSGLKELYLECCCSDIYASDLHFYCHLFSKMPSLERLELTNCHLRSSLGSQCNNSLQYLVLRRVRVCPGALDCILSNCRQLQLLTIIRCKCLSKLSFCGPHLELKYLYIRYCDYVEEIEFYASNLVVFEFWNHESINLKFDHVPQLQSVFLHISDRNIVPYVCGRLAVDLPHLKSLNLVTTGADFQKSSARMGTNMFNNLRRLDIDMRSLPQSDLRSLISILQECPLLRELQLNLDINFLRTGSRLEKQAVVFHPELRKVEIGGFGGTLYEIEFALYILKSAISLEKMHISKHCKEYRCCKEYQGIYKGSGRWVWLCAEAPWSEEDRRKIQRKLQGKAVSPTAQLCIQHDPMRNNNVTYNSSTN